MEIMDVVYGYVRVADGGQIEPGCEYYSPTEKQWKPVFVCGTKSVFSVEIRRPVAVPPGYELVPEAEARQFDDTQAREGYRVLQRGMNQWLTNRKCYWSENVEAWIRPVAVPTAATEPDAGYGWRLLQRGDNIITGDEFYDLDGWHRRTEAIGEIINADHCPTRRRIDPGEGWEIVPENELESKSMEFWHTSGSWNKNEFINNEKPVGKYAKHGSPIRAFRRRVAPVAAPLPSCDWVPVAERLPEPKQPIWTFAGDTTMIHVSGYSNPEELIEDKWVYWQPATVPAPPPQPSESEQAYQNRILELGGSTEVNRNDFMAGYEAAKKGSK